MSFENPVWLTIVLVYTAVLFLYDKRIDVGWQIFGLGVLLFTPTFGTTDCYYRHMIVAFQLFVMIGMSLDNRYRKYLVGAYFLVSIYLCYQYFLPAYKNGLLM